MPILDQESLEAIENKLKALLPPPIGTQKIPTGLGTKEVLAISALLKLEDMKG